jgi:hypothetical protein
MKFRHIYPVAAGLLAVAVLTGSPAEAPAAGACDTLRTEFTKKLRPRILRLAKKEFHWSNWYHATLKREHKGSKHPTPEAMQSTYNQMLDYCAGNDKCKKFAGEMNTASQAIYDINKRWSAAGCPGQLDR